VSNFDVIIGQVDMQFFFREIIIIIIIIIISGSTVLVRTLAASHTEVFVILLRHTVGLLSTSDQPVSKVSTYTGQHNI
jgi:hypothetical protein